MKSIYVAWQDPESRQWSPVGLLTKDDYGFKFAYTHGAKLSSNFIPFGRMHDLNVVYKSKELFPLFKNRILSRSRPEYEAYLHWLGMNREQYDVMDELSRTAGLRATDSLELFHCPVPTDDKKYVELFFTRGLRHMHMDNQERANALVKGDEIFLMRDMQNRHDPMALLLRTEDPISLMGYVPKYYSNELCQLIDKNGHKEVKVTVQQVNADAPIQYKVLCKIETPWPSTFSPCSDKSFQVIV